ncbi:MAG: hypothetical protein R3213_13400 [Flavobacteriaceae bacterium]|nr:hypothetical protein [Flavobacteriaceae bacterium]
MDREKIILDSMASVDPVNTKDLQSIVRIAISRFVARTGSDNRADIVGALEQIKFDVLCGHYDCKYEKPHQRDILGEDS